MAKTTKKPVSVKKNSKTSRSFWQKLVPRSPRAKLLTFLVVFAIMGGGVMAYRSFAATGANLYVASQLQVYKGSGNIVTDGGQKRGIQVFVLSPSSSVNIHPNYTPIIWAPYIRACASVKMLDGGSQQVNIHVAENGWQIGSAQHTINDSFNYRKVCTPYVRHNNANARLNAHFENLSNFGQSWKVEVSSVSIEYMN